MGLMSAQPRYSDRAVMLDESEDHQLDSVVDETDDDLLVSAQKRSLEKQLSSVADAARSFNQYNEDYDVQQRPGEPTVRTTQSSSKRDNPLGSVFGEVSIFRDFFLAAFSDGYNNIPCCGQEGFFPGSGFGFNASRGSRVAPATVDMYPPNDVSTLKHVTSSQSSHESNNMPATAAVAAARRRKKPLAVAVGFNYANDMNGRPIVITPGCRRQPIDPTRNSSGTVVAGGVALPHRYRSTSPPSPQRFPPSGSCSSPQSGDCRIDISTVTSPTNKPHVGVSGKPMILQE